MGRLKTKPRPKVLQRQLDRSFRACGSCRACCYALGISAIKKPTWTHCVHECAQGCQLHAQVDYPPECRKYFCEWRKPYLQLQDADRPDLLGLVLDIRETTRGPLLTAWELVPNAAEQPNALDLVTRISTTQLIALIPWRLPDGVDTERAHAWAKQHGLELPAQKRLLGPQAQIQAFLKRPERKVAGTTL